jgi:hypothetical protein
MDELMAIAEIEARYPSEWVFVEDPQTDERLQVLAGRVRCHSKDRDEVYRKALELRPKRSAMLYTGTVPEQGEALL